MKWRQCGLSPTWTTLSSKDGWPPLVDADCHAFSQAIYKGIEGEEWEELYCHCRDMSKATGAKKAK